MLFNMFLKIDGFVKVMRTRHLGYGQKKGATPCSNLVNLKSNTMKNTVQRYGFWVNLQINGLKNYVI